MTGHVPRPRVASRALVSEVKEQVWPDPGTWVLSGYVSKCSHAADTTGIRPAGTLGS